MAPPTDVCPECGLPPQSPAELSRRPRWPARLGWFIALALAATVALQTWRTAPRQFPQRWDHGFIGPLLCVGNGFTREQLVQISKGQGDGSLARALKGIADQPEWGNFARPARMQAYLDSPRGVVDVTRTWGWPFMVYSVRINRGYGDIYQRTDPYLSNWFSIPDESRGRWLWWSLGVNRYDSTDDTWIDRRFEPLGIVANIAFAVALWRFSWWVLRRVRRRASWVNGRLSAALALSAALIVSVASAFVETFTQHASNSTFAQVRIVPGLTRDSVRSMAAADEAQVAGLILETLHDQSGFLAASFTETVPCIFVDGNFGWPIHLFQIYSYTRLPADRDGNAAGQFAPVQPIARVENVRITLGHWAGAQQRTIFWVSGKMFALLGVLWLAGWLTACTARLALRRRGTRRRRRHLCVNCGYPIAPANL